MSNARIQKSAVAVVTPDTHAANVRTSLVSSERLQSQELTTSTSLDDLFKAILGDQAGEVDDRALLLETVEAQVRSIRDELGLPEPIVEPPTPSPTQGHDVISRVSALEIGEEPPPASSNGGRSVTKRVPGLLKLVAGLAWSRSPHSVALLAVVGGVLVLS